MFLCGLKFSFCKLKYFFLYTPWECSVLGEKISSDFDHFLLKMQILPVKNFSKLLSGKHRKNKGRVVYFILNLKMSFQTIFCASNRNGPQYKPRSGGCGSISHPTALSCT